MTTDKVPNQLSMTVDPVVIEKIVKEHVSASIALAMRDQGMDFHEVIVKQILQARVDSYGKITLPGDRDYGRTKRSWFDQTLMKLIHDSARSALEDYVKEQEPKIRKALHAEFDRRSRGMIRAMVDGSIKALTNKWQFKFDIKMFRDEDTA